MSGPRKNTQTENNTFRKRGPTFDRRSQAAGPPSTTDFRGVWACLLDDPGSEEYGPQAYEFIGFGDRGYSFLCNFLMPYVTQCCSRAGNRPFGPDFGRTATWKAPKSALRPAFGRPEGRFRCFPGSSPTKIQPGSPTYGPEALLRNIECVWLGALT
jgi:hypothetical protein